MTTEWRLVSAVMKRRLRLAPPQAMLETASVLVKVRTATTEQLQDVLRRIYAIDGVSGTQVTVVLETFFERPVPPFNPSRPDGG
jgi:hypothetical protein